MAFTFDRHDEISTQRPLQSNVWQAEDIYRELSLKFTEEARAAEGLEMLVRHTEYLTEQHNFCAEQIDGLHRQAETGSLNHAETIYLTNLVRQQDIIEQAIGRIREQPDDVRRMVGEQAELMLYVCEEAHIGEGFPDTPEGRKYLESKEYMDAFYGKSRDNTWDYYGKLDILYEAGQERVLDNLDFDSKRRAVEDCLVPQELRHAKWGIMVAVTDVENGIGLSDIQADIVAHLHAELSKHERGADNDHIPITHKQRHNPAIHSLHVSTLVRRIFDDARERLEESREFSALGDAAQGQALALFEEKRHALLFAALLHDGGEVRGELSQGILVAGMKAADQEQLQETRARKEEAFFSEFLDEVRQKHYSYLETPQWQGIKDEFMEGFRLAEHLEAFDGRLLKAVERMQSQHDYSRFSGMNEAPPLFETAEENRAFSMNYVAEPMFDTKFYTEAVTDTAGKILEKARFDTRASRGEHALRTMVGAEDPLEMLVNQAVYDAAQAEYKWLEEKLVNDYALARNGVVIVGKAAPETEKPDSGRPDSEKPGTVASGLQVASGGAKRAR